MTQKTEPLIDVDDARARILALAPALGSERVPLSAIAHDPQPRVLAAVTTSLRALPPFDNSAMDGYALRAQDVSAPGTQLRIAATSLAGHGSSTTIGPGTCAAITTGAPLPPGVDAVVMREFCDEARAHEGFVVVNAASTSKLPSSFFGIAKSVAPHVCFTLLSFQSLPLGNRTVRSFAMSKSVCTACFTSVMFVFYGGVAVCGRDGLNFFERGARNALCVCFPARSAVSRREAPDKNRRDTEV